MLGLLLTIAHGAAMNDDWAWLFVGLFFLLVILGVPVGGVFFLLHTLRHLATRTARTAQSWRLAAIHLFGGAFLLLMPSFEFFIWGAIVFYTVIAVMLILGVRLLRQPKKASSPNSSPDASAT